MLIRDIRYNRKEDVYSRLIDVKQTKELGRIIGAEATIYLNNPVSTLINKLYDCKLIYVKFLDDTQVGDLLFMDERVNATKEKSINSVFGICLEKANGGNYGYVLYRGIAIVDEQKDVNFGDSVYLEEETNKITNKEQKYSVDNSVFLANNCVLIGE